MIIRSLAVVLFKIFFRLGVFGRENIPAKGGFLLAGNHVSYLDPPLTAAACPRVASFLAKESLFSNKLFGGFIAMIGAFPLKSHSANLKALRWAISELKAGKVIAIFPEGARSADDRLRRPLPGVGFLAVKANVPIVPVLIEGSNRALPVGSKFIRFFTKIRVYFGAPIYPEQVGAYLDKEIYERLAEKTMEAIAQLKNRAKNKEKRSG